MLRSRLTLKGIYERSDVDVRRKEGLQEATGVLWGEQPPAEIDITEFTVRFQVDIQHGHKTGFYLDQKPNRLLLHDLLENTPSSTC